MLQSIKNNFDDIIALLVQLNEEAYILKHPEISDATIGQHVRHIIEMYQTLIKSYHSGILNYDARERNLQMENDINFAVTTIKQLVIDLEVPNKDLELILNANSEESIQTNYYRELVYNLEHSIHHQALIKVVVLKNKNLRVNENFGVAKSTIEYKLKCAQ